MSEIEAFIKLNLTLGNVIDSNFKRACARISEVRKETGKAACKASCFWSERPLRLASLAACSDCANVSNSPRPAHSRDTWRSAEKLSTVNEHMASIKIKNAGQIFLTVFFSRYSKLLMPVLWGLS